MDTEPVPISKPSIDAREVAAAKRVILSGRLTQGPEVESLEVEFAEAIGARHAVAVANGSTALELALRALGVGPGDEVITSPFSFFATAGSILNAGATPVFADVDPESCNLDPDAAASVVTSRSAAILPVHLYGRPCDMHRFTALAKRHGLALIEDACQAIGARYEKQSVGTFGVGCFSFYGSKNITCGEGGIVTIPNAALARKIKALRNHGSERHYVHTSVSSNYRLTDIQAAILRVQLTRLRWITRRREQIAGVYDKLLSSEAIVPPPPNDLNFQSCYHAYTIRVPRKREALRAKLQAAGIETRIYYPRPIYRQPAWPRKDIYQPNAERCARQVLSIPMYPGLESTQARFVASLLNQFRG